MSTPILDRARAFDLIAQHLPDEKRTEIATALGDKLLEEVKPSPRREAPGGSPEPADPVDLSAHTDTALFLVDKGLTGSALVKATGALTSFLAGSEFAHLTRDARMQTWWASRAEREVTP